MFLDAALMLRGKPVAHLTAAWAALLPSKRQPGDEHAPTLQQLRASVEGMWAAVVGASLASLDVSGR